MIREFRRGRIVLGAMAAIAIVCVGCTKPSEYVQNGFKVGPNYCCPTANVAEHWIDATDKRVREDVEVPTKWWSVFRDPVLNRLVLDAYHQNLTLREAGLRVLEARYQLAITTGQIFPQSQNAFGNYRRIGSGGNFFNQWNFGFNLGWELDFWGRFRRAIDSAEDQLDASVAGYDDVMVTLLADIAGTYVRIRGDQEQIKLLKADAELQRGVLQYIENRFQAGAVTELDFDQAKSNLAQTEAAIPQLEIDLRQANNRLCTLLGIPTVDLTERLGAGPIPTSPPEAAVGIPAELLRRRPDVRRAQSLAMAQAEQIGIAESDLYPAFTINGTLGYQAREFSQLFSSNAFNGSIGPSFQWNILNYGRISNNVRLQDARFHELVVTYQNTVLQANQEVEDGLAAFLNAQKRAILLEESVVNSRKAVNIVIAQYEGGKVDFNRYAVIVQSLVLQQNALAQAQSQIALGLIEVYRALGGGWQIRLLPETELAEAEPIVPVRAVEEVPVPEPPEKAAAEKPAAKKPAAEKPQEKPATVKKG